MEDAVDALKMAFSVFAFVIALSIVFTMFSQARAVSDIVIAHSDNTYFDDYEFPITDSDGVIDTNGRVVGIESVIPMLYTYSDGKTVIEIVSNGTLEELFDLETEGKYFRRANGYETSSVYRSSYGYSCKYSELYSNNTNNISWLSNKNDQDLRVSAFVAGANQKINTDEVRYGNRTNLKNIRNSTFIEKFTERNDYSGDRLVYSDGSVIDLSKGTQKRYITYVKQEI